MSCLLAICTWMPLLPRFPLRRGGWIWGLLFLLMRFGILLFMFLAFAWRSLLIFRLMWCNKCMWCRWLELAHASQLGLLPSKWRCKIIKRGHSKPSTKCIPSSIKGRNKNWIIWSKLRKNGQYQLKILLLNVTLCQLQSQRLEFSEKILNAIKIPKI